MTVAFFVAATVVTLLQFVRLRERRLLPLLFLFALTAAGHAADDAGWARAWHLCAGTVGLALVLLLSPRHPAGR